MGRETFPASSVFHRAGRPATLALAVFCAVGLALNIAIAVLNRAGWGIDYNQFYAASQLAGTGHVYDWDALRKIEVQNGIPIPTGRLPVVLYGHKILGGIPYGTARFIWTAASVAALILCAAFWPGGRPSWMIAALAWSTPAMLVVLYGQDTPFWMISFCAGLLLLERKKLLSAGVAFSLCICKFHLALGIPIMLAAQRRWRTLIAGAIAGLVWIAAGFLIEGPGWTGAYWKITHLAGFSPAPERMPNLHGLVSRLPWTAAAEVLLAGAAALLLWKASRVCHSIGLAGAAAAACGLLMGRHAYANDCVILIPLSVLILQQDGAPQWLKFWAAVTLTPILALLLVSGQPLLGQMLIAGFALAVIATVSARPPLGRRAQAVGGQSGA